MDAHVAEMFVGEQTAQEVQVYKRMTCCIAAAHELQQRAILSNAREIRRLIDDMLKFVSKEEFSPEIRNWMDEQELEYSELIAQVDPKFLSFTEHKDGEQDNLKNITYVSYVDEQGNVHGPEYNTNTGYWNMDEEHVRARETRMENGEPYDWTEKPMHWSRMRHDDEGTDANPERGIVLELSKDSLEANHHVNDYLDIGGFSSLDRRTDAQKLAVYYKNGGFHENIRILVNGQGFPLGVLPDFKPTEEYETIEIPVMVFSGAYETKFDFKFHEIENAPNVRDVKVDDQGHVYVIKTYKPKYRVFAYKCELLRTIWNHFDKVSDDIKNNYRACATRAAMVRNTEEVMVPEIVTDESGQMVIDEKGRPKWRTKKIQKIIKGGLQFRGSKQLNPDEGCAYSDDPRYSFVNFAAKSLAERFKEMARRGHLETCRKVEYRGDERVVTKQGYALLSLKIKNASGIRKIMVCVFSDLRE